MYWFIMLITRFVFGERVNKPTPEENRLASAYFLFFPIFGGAALKFSAKFIHGATDSVYLLVGLATIAVAYFVVMVWAKFIPAAVTWTLAGIAWAVVIYGAIRGDLF
jgi:hypothetical protein